MPVPRVKSIRFFPADPPPDAASGESELEVRLDDGRFSSFRVATFDRPEAWARAAKDGAWSKPVLLVERLDRACVEAAVAEMAADMGGYWLRYYNSLGELSRRGAAVKAAATVARVDLVELSDAGRPDRSSGVIEVYLKDGRQFSLLAATPSWFRAEAARLGLRCYYGAPLLFLRRLTPEAARRAAKAMFAEDEQLLVRYDTPRRTPVAVLAAFAAARPGRPKTA